MGESFSQALSIKKEKPDDDDARWKINTNDYKSMHISVCAKFRGYP